jgi:hypothetical protein
MLPGGGWPLGCLVEVHPNPLPHVGAELFLPAMAARLEKAERRAVWVAPPWILHAPGLQQGGLDPTQMLVVDTGGMDRETLWAMEQFLSCPTCAMALGWVREAPPAALRRLQLAAAQGHGLGILFRPQGCSRPSPAPVRLQVRPGETGLSVELVRLRGALGRRRILVE